MDWPQIVIIALFVMGFTVNTLKHGEDRGKFNMWGSILGISIWVSILYAGGFWS